MKILFDDFTDDNLMPDLTDFVPRAPYPEFTQTDTQYIIKGNISSAGGDSVSSDGADCGSSSAVASFNA